MNKNKQLTYDVNSWHFRLGAFTWNWIIDPWTIDPNNKPYHKEYPPSNLCPYIRRVLLSFIFGPIFWCWRRMPEFILDHEELVQILSIYGVIVHGIYFIMGLISGGSITTDIFENGKVIGTNEVVLEWWYGWAFYFGSIASVILIGATIIGIGSLVDKIRNSREHDPNAGKTLEIFHDMIEANHEKICPSIKFVDSNKLEE